MNQQQHTRPSVAAPTKTVLMVKDNPIVRTTMGRLLETAGYELLSAGQGSEAIALLKQHGVDVVLTDHFMPDMNGLDLLKVVARAAPNARRILMTADRGGQVAIEALSSGHVDQFVNKPIGQQKLLSIIEQAVRRSRTPRGTE